MKKELLLKPLMLLIIVIAASAILVRAFTGGQTISEYADENNIPHHAEEIEEVDKNE